MPAGRSVAGHTPFIQDGHADSTHGKRITSLIVQAHVWNSNLDLPPLVCRVGTVQAVPRQRANLPYNPEALIDYLARVVREHPEAKVWNFSFNQIEPEDDFEVIFLPRRRHQQACPSRQQAGAVAVTAAANLISQWSVNGERPDRILDGAGWRLGLVF